MYNLPFQDSEGFQKNKSTIPTEANFKESINLNAQSTNHIKTSLYETFKEVNSLIMHHKFRIILLTFLYYCNLKFLSQ